MAVTVHKRREGAQREPAMQATQGFCVAERHGLLAMRAWVRVLNAENGSKEAQMAMTRWSRLFADIGGREASHAFDQLLGLLALHTRQPIRAGCACCGRASVDELRLLAYLGAVWHRVDSLSDEIIRHWLSLERRGTAEQFGRLYGYAMSRYGCELPIPRPARLRRIAAETLVQSSEIRPSGAKRHSPV